MTGAKKSQNLPFASGDPGKLVVIQSKGLRTRELINENPAHRQKMKRDVMPQLKQ